MKIETKYFGGKITEVTEVKEGTRNGINIGIISGYIATWDIDRVGDQFIKGCFANSIREHKERNNRPIRLKNCHGRLIGGFPIESVVENDIGLFGRGEINLQTQQGRESYALAKQGIITDLSIGFTAVKEEFDGGVRRIPEAIVWEGSPVDEPANIDANITEVKSLIEKASDIEGLKKALNEAKSMPHELIDSIVKYTEAAKKGMIFLIEDFKSLSERELEDKLKTGASFSGKNAKAIISCLKVAGLRDGDDGIRRDGENWAEIKAALTEINKTIGG